MAKERTGRRRAAWLHALPGCAAAVLLAVPAAAQPAVDPEIDPTPFDVRMELRELFRTQMPTAWWFEDPQLGAGGFTVVVHIPKGWRGNPTGAVMRFCPPRHHRIWTGAIERFFIRPFHQDRPWPTYECRP